MVQPAKWPLGPPAPAWMPWLARLVSLALLIVVGHWVQVYLGGVSMSADRVEGSPDTTDTKRLFNWHPVLMTLAFGVFMAEAVMTYAAPVVPQAPRPLRKKIHASLHTAASVCALLGVWAAFESHWQKLPVPIPDLYSVHSYLGLTALILFAIQFAVGFGSYLYPQASLPTRLALGPVHKFTGKATWVCGLAAMATGLQEKSTFVSQGAKLSGDQLFGPVMRLPAVAVLLTVLLGILVLYQQVPPAKPIDDDKSARESLLVATDSDPGHTHPRVVSDPV